MSTLEESVMEIDDAINDMLDKVSTALDLLEKKEVDEAMSILAECEENMLDYLGYEVCECEEEGEEEAENAEITEEKKPAKTKAPSKKSKPSVKTAKKK